MMGLTAVLRAIIFLLKPHNVYAALYTAFELDGKARTAL